MTQFTSREEYDAYTREKLLGHDECPFCYLASDAKNILHTTEYWAIWRNIFPYSGDDDHLMVVPLRHITYEHELTREELSEFTAVYIYLQEYYGEKQYFSCTRETLSNRSIEHYHKHFIPGKLQGGFLRKMLELQGFPIHEELSIEGK